MVQRVRICTQYKRDRFTFRCHPAFHSGNAIFDWMLFKFETEAIGSQEPSVDYFYANLLLWYSMTIRMLQMMMMNTDLLFNAQLVELV